MDERNTFGEMNWAGPAMPSVMVTMEPGSERLPLAPTATHVLGLGQAMSMSWKVPATT
jgi:hypothetical protein